MKKELQHIVGTLALLSVAACGGGGGGAPAATPPAPVQPSVPPAYSASVKVSPTPQFTPAQAPLTQALFASALRYQPAGTSFITGMDGARRAFVFPTLFYADPQLPAVEFRETSPDVFAVSNVLNDVLMGNARDWRTFSQADGGRAFVVVDHGSEYSNVNGVDWPHGHVWVARDKGQGFQFTQVSSVRGFYHSVALGDLGGTGREDIVALNMGTKGGVPETLHRFAQNSDGSFTQASSFIPDGTAWSSGSVAIGDLDNDGTPELVHGAYSTLGPPEEGSALRIWKRSSDGSFARALTLAREGNFVNMGSTQVQIADIDNDSLPDLILALEGTETQAGVTQGVNAIEVYRNKGKLQFERVTGQVLATSRWTTSELKFRELAVADVNADGYVDIVLQGWNGGLLRETPLKWNVGAMILKNTGGTSFAPQHGQAGATVTFTRSADMPLYLRFMRVENRTLKLFGMSQEGAPVVVTLTAN